MQIEQFDTGLKTKTNVQDIILSPEKNLQNKNLIRGYLNKIITSGVSEIDKNLDEAFINDVKINSFYPINEFEGLKNLKEKPSVFYKMDFFYEMQLFVLYQNI